MLSTLNSTDSVPAPRPRRRILIAARALMLGAVGMALLAGCGELSSPEIFEPETDAAKLYGSLTLDHRAINLSTVAPYDTFRIAATPRNMLGEPLAGLPEPTFHSSDTVAVWVTPDGLIQARSPAAGVAVVAEVATGANMRHADTAYVTVVANPAPPMLETFAIEFASPEHASMPMSAFGGDVVDILLMAAGIPVTQAVPVSALSEGGLPVHGLEIEFRSLDPENIVIDQRTGTVDQVVGPPGEVAILARTAAYGVIREDTALVRVTGPLSQAVDIRAAGDGTLVIEPREVILRPGGYVLWWNMDESWTLSMIFDDPSRAKVSPEMCAVLHIMLVDICETGNISPHPGSNQITHGPRVRQFFEVGDHEYEIPEVGFRGRVRVVTDDDPIWDTLGGGS